MAELLSLNQANASVNDTYQGLKIVQLLDAPNGRYRWQLNASSSASAATNLSYTASASNGIVASDTGTDATLPLSDNTNAGLLPPGIIHPSSPAAALPATALREGQLFVRTGATAPGIYTALDTVGNWRGPL